MLHVNMQENRRPASYKPTHYQLSNNSKTTCGLTPVKFTYHCTEQPFFPMTINLHYLKKEMDEK